MASPRPVPAESRRGPGRPRTGRGIDGVAVLVRLTPDERLALALAAEVHGEGVAEYLRSAGLARAKRASAR